MNCLNKIIVIFFALSIVNQVEAGYFNWQKGLRTYPSSSKTQQAKKKQSSEPQESVQPKQKPTQVVGAVDSEESNSQDSFVSMPPTARAVGIVDDSKLFENIPDALAMEALSNIADVEKDILEASYKSSSPVIRLRNGSGQLVPIPRSDIQKVSEFGLTGRYLEKITFDKKRWWDFNKFLILSAFQRPSFTVIEYNEKKPFLFRPKIRLEEVDLTH